MRQKRKVHVLLMDNYFPELCELTIPTIETWARKIGAELNLITKRRWPDWPLLTEKQQVWYEGEGCDWNVLIDADVLVHPEAPDFLGTFLRPDHVGSKDAYDADKMYRIHEPYFLRDGRNIGLSACMLAASGWCHDLWRPLPDEMPLSLVETLILQERKCIDEYCFSRNLARFGLKLSPVVDPATHYNDFFHLGVFGEDKGKVLDAARSWYRKHLA